MKSISTYCFSLPQFVSYVVMMMAAEMVQLNTSRWWDPLVSIAFNTVFYSALAWLICFMAAVIGRRLGLLFHVLAHVVLAIYSVSELLLYFLFDRHWDAYTMQFLRETNWKETSEFCATYMVDWRFIGLVSVLVALFVVEIAACKCATRRRLIPSSKRAKMTLVCWLGFMLAQVVFFSTDAVRNYDLAAWCHAPIKRNSIWNLWQSCLMYSEFSEEFEKCSEVLRSYNENPACEERDADVVLIIGESFSRHMSNLYDGKYNTNPLLLRRKLHSGSDSVAQYGKMYVFSDVIATDNGTTQNFKYFMSMASVAERGEKWFAQPLFPVVLRRCGYNVTYYSNQFAPNDNLGQWDASMGFVNHPGIEPMLFDHRNTHKYAYDLDLVGDYAAHRNQLERKSRNFCIFHLYGQHVNFFQRYPDSFSRFRAVDVNPHYQMSPHADGTLDMGQRKDVADYLNATAYNDIVVDSIIRLFESRNAIIIYFSDHGEEVHNFRRQYGRTGLDTDSHNAMRCQLDVPLLVYLSPAYVSKHPDNVRRLGIATSRKFTTDNIPHMLFDILGVKSVYFRAERSIMSDKYREPSKRLLQNGRLYDL